MTRKGSAFSGFYHGAPRYRSFSTELDRAISRLRLAGRGESLNWANGWDTLNKTGSCRGCIYIFPASILLHLG